MLKKYLGFGVVPHPCNSSTPGADGRDARPETNKRQASICKHIKLTINSSLGGTGGSWGVTGSMKKACSLEVGLGAGRGDTRL